MTRAREISNVLGRNIESTTFTATAGQTAFSITHAAGRIQVYMNGLLLDPTVDWTSDGSTVTLTEGAVAGDELEVVKFDNLAVADAIPRTGHTGTIDFSDATFTPPAGHVVQVVNGTYNTEVNNATTSFIDTGLQLSITPTSTSSKILILIEQHTRYQANYDQGVGFKILRDSTAIFTSATNFDEYSYDGDTTTTFDVRGRKSLMWFDSPSTTNSITYKVQAALYRGDYSPSMRFQDNNNYSFMTLMEIAQ